MSVEPADRMVTIGVPVYQGERFLAETLRSIQQQTDPAFQVIVSLDGPQPEAAAICGPFLEDSRFRLVTQPTRLGWARHISWLMSQVDTPYWCYHQHDDLMEPRYLEVLRAHAFNAPEAAVVYCDIEAFGAVTGVFSQASVMGSAPARQLALLYEHQAAVAFRGLTRVEALRLAGGIPSNAVDNVASDTVWMAAVARWGNLRRVGMTLYRKRYHDANVHMSWFAWPAAKRRQGWLVHCAAMLEQALLVEATAAERRFLWLATLRRLVTPRLASSYVSIADMSLAERRLLFEEFFSEVQRAGIDLPGCLEADWSAIHSWSAHSFDWMSGATPLP